MAQRRQAADPARTYSSILSQFPKGKPLIRGELTFEKGRPRFETTQQAEHRRGLEEIKEVRR